MTTSSGADRLAVAAVQLSCQDQLAANLAECARWVRVAAERGAELVLLPENFAFMGPEVEKRGIAERLGDLAAPIQHALSAMARENGVVLCAGGLPEASGDAQRPLNTHCV